MTEKKPQTPRELLDGILAFIATTREHVEEGGEVDLDGLDEKVRELCEAVLDMPKPEADTYAEELQTMAEDLTLLKASMEKAQKEVRQQVEALNLRHKAAKAYKTSEATKPAGNPKDKK